ncbi:MAG: hypothetical protein EOP49_33035, partial [Sphingobacteriales bacterium]
MEQEITIVTHNNISSFLILTLMLCLNSLAFAQNANLPSPEVQTVERTDLVKGEWVKQKGKTVDYRFEVFVLLSKGTSDFLGWNGIKVIDRHTGQPIQLIGASGESMMLPATDRLVGLLDFNFDGRLDFRIQTSDGGAGPNVSANFYAYDIKARRFIFDKQLSEMTQVFINAENKTIISAYRTPGMTARESQALGMAASVLSQGNSSRMYQKMVDVKKNALQVASFNYGLEDYGAYLTFAIPNNDTPLDTLLQDKLTSDEATTLSHLLDRLR